jgi:hypothetical protein
MKRILLIVVLMATLSVQEGFAQDNQGQVLLSSYYDIKNALVNSDASAAAARAGDFLKLISFKSYQDKLAFNARHISESKDIAHQREHFAGLSADFYKLAKAVKLSGQPIYYDYCPMNKTYWLSASKDIKNPYYGKQMLTCGKVSDIIE